MILSRLHRQASLTEGVQCLSELMCIPVKAARFSNELEYRLCRSLFEHNADVVGVDRHSPGLGKEWAIVSSAGVSYCVHKEWMVDCGHQV